MATQVTTAADSPVTTAWSKRRILPRLEVYSSTDAELLFSRIRGTG